MVGARVQAKAHHVTALAECHRRYGAANAKTKFVDGTVVVSVDAAASSRGRRAATLITAEYELGWWHNQEVPVEFERDQDSRHRINH